MNEIRARIKAVQDRKDNLYDFNSRFNDNVKTL